MFWTVSGVHLPRVMAWNPSPDLPPYHGPYPKGELKAARMELIRLLRNDVNNLILEQVKPRIGINSRFGPAIPLKPVLVESIKNSPKLFGVAGYNGPATVDKPNSTAGHSSSSAGMSPVSPASGKHMNESLSAAESSLTSFEESDISLIEEEGSFEKPAVTEAKQQQRFKCDYCSFLGMSRQQSLEHLHHTQHATASLYRVNIQGPTTRLTAILKRMAVRNIVNPTKSLVVVCPHCNSTFTDIFTCGMHTRLSHAAPQDCYAVCPVIKEDLVEIAREPPVCKACDHFFNSHSLLHRHWQEQPAHDPIKSITPGAAFASLMCILCSPERVFYNFMEIKKHLLTSHFTKCSSSHFSLRARIILSPKQVDYLPVDEEPVSPGQRRDVGALKRMNSNLKYMGIKKSEAKRLRTELKNMHGRKSVWFISLLVNVLKN